jgi:uncharacterized protein YdhG (YjbR/CyaY superfamily)
MQFRSVDEYIAAQPQSVQDALKRVRRAILQAVPEAQECISYNMPTYKIGGRRIVHFAGWKTHYALYAASESIVKNFRSELAKYEIEKGTIRFPLSETVPEKLIGRIAKFRAAETKTPA